MHEGTVRLAPNMDAAEMSAASYERHPVEDIEPLPPPDDRTADAIGRILRWLGANLELDRNPALLGVKTAALLYIVRPDMLDGRPASEIAARLGASKQGFNKQLRSFLRWTGYRGRHLRTPEVRAHAAEIMRASHARRAAEMEKARQDQAQRAIEQSPTLPEQPAPDLAPDLAQPGQLVTPDSAPQQ